MQSSIDLIKNLFTTDIGLNYTLWFAVNKTNMIKEILSSHDEIVLSINNDVDGHKQCLLLDEKHITFGVTLDYVYLLHKINIT